jgi:hypothetical protein
MVAQSNLILHCGARLVKEDELRAVPTPEPQGRWRPISHYSVLSHARTTLQEAGYKVRREQLALSRNDARFFGTLDLEAALVNGVTLAVAVRSSTDQSFPLGLIGGQRVFACDNLAFRADLFSVRRKHTINGEKNFANDIALAVARLDDFRKVEATRIRQMQYTDISDETADSLILRSFEKGIISAPILPRVIKEWREPSFEEFQERTLFNLFQAFTTVLSEKAQTQPQLFVTQTMRLNHHLLENKENQFAIPT